VKEEIMLDGCTPFPDEFARRYRTMGFWRGECLGDLPREWAARFGTRTALVHRDRRISYTDLESTIARTAAGLRAHGIAAGDRVVVQLPNAPEFVILCFALFRIDAKPVFALLAHRADEIRHLCTLSGAVAYIVPGGRADFDYAGLAADTMAHCPDLRQVFVVGGDARGLTVFADVAEPVEETSASASDVAFFLLSGGTTALPKLIPRTHDDYVYQTSAAAQVTGLRADDVYLAVLPLEFNFTWGCPGVVGTLRAGGAVVLADDADPDDCFALIEREKVTVTSVVPTIAQLWLDAAGPCLPSLRLVQVGGAPLHREIAERIGPAFDCQLQQVFGMAEGLITCTRLNDPAETTVSTQGKPISPADEIRVVDEEGDPVAPGEVGELLARGPYTLRGYYRAPDHNVRAFTPDGFYRTGDLARLTADGDLVVEGRLKDVIIRGGYKISASEVERHLLAHPSVDRVAVVPIPDRYLGERICAYVRAAGEPPTLFDLREALAHRGIADYKLPDRLEIVPDLPLTGLGKVDKLALAGDAALKAVQ
jgi:2,3-dihydroxybenzoate-AMP ligase